MKDSISDSVLNKKRAITASGELLCVFITHIYSTKNLLETRFVTTQEDLSKLLIIALVGFPLHFIPAGSHRTFSSAAFLRRACSTNASSYIIRKWKWVCHETMPLLLPVAVQVETHVLMFAALSALLAMVLLPQALADFISHQRALEPSRTS